MKFDREESLKVVGGTSDWRNIRTWIADMVRLEPQVMREVSNARFSDLGSWIERGGRNVGCCGCLVGTTALKLIRKYNHFKPWGDVNQYGHLACTVDIGGHDAGDIYVEVPDAVNALIKEHRDEMIKGTERAGMAASNLACDWFGDNKTAVALIKSEIRAQLLLRARHIRGGLKRARAAKRKADGTFAKVA